MGRCCLALHSISEPPWGSPIQALSMPCLASEIIQVEATFGLLRLRHFRLGEVFCLQVNSTATGAHVAICCTPGIVVDLQHSTGTCPHASAILGIHCLFFDPGTLAGGSHTPHQASQNIHPMISPILGQSSIMPTFRIPPTHMMFT